MALLGKKKKPEHKEQFKQQQQQRKPGSKIKLAAKAIVIAVIIIAALYFLFFLNVNETVINSPTVVNITQAGNLYGINSNQYYISLASISVNTGSAYIHITRLPIFVNPLLNITLTLTNITQVNEGTNYSNMALQLQSLSPNSISVKITPLLESLQIRPTYQYIKVIQSNLYGNQQGSTTVPTTTTAGTTSTTTAGTTTSTIAINQTQAAINAALAADSYYALMLNFSKLYANTSNCNANLYNNIYVNKYGHLPSGPYTYVNVSPFTPYNLSSTTTLSNAGTYNVSFIGKTAALGNLPAVTINVNPTTKATVDTIAPASRSGIFADLTIAQIRSNYATAYLQGACGVMLG